MKTFYPLIKRILLVSIFLILSGCFFTSCKEKKKKEKEIGEEELKSRLINVNRQLTKDESEEIDAYIRQVGWKMEKSGTGLRFHINKLGKGSSPKPKQFVIIKYTARTINGEPRFSRTSGKQLLFELGKGQLPNGLEEAIMMMKPGDRAKIILPSHLGFGLSGDDKGEVGPREILIYDLELIEIREK